MRTLRLTPAFDRAVRRHRVSGTAAGRALASTLASLRASELPGPLDFEAMIPPVRKTWVRRVPGANLWVFYTFAANELVAVTLSASPPVPTAR